MTWIRSRRPTAATALALVAVLLVGVAGPAAGGNVGDLDTTFSSDGRQTANFTTSFDPGFAAAVQDDGKVLAAGRSGGNGGRMFLARYNTNGTIDTTFGGTGRVFVDFGPKDEAATDIAIDTNGDIVIAGAANDGQQMGIARFNSDGTPDTSFSADGKRTANFSTSDEFADDLIIDSNGDIVLAGSMIVSGWFQVALARFNPDGTLDTSFSGDGRTNTNFGTDDDLGLALTEQADGKLVVSGVSGLTPNGPPTAARGLIGRYNANGTLDTTFSGDGKLTLNTSPNGYEDLAGVDVQTDGKIVVVGESNARLLLVRVSSTGVLDPSFSGDGRQILDRPGSPEWVSDLRLQEDGKIVISGEVGGAGGRMLLARFETDGDPDPTFSGDGFIPIDFSPQFDIAWDVAIQPDGNIVGVGSAEDDRKLALARVLGDALALTVASEPVPETAPTEPTPPPETGYGYPVGQSSLR